MKNTAPKNYHATKGVSKNSCLYCGTSFSNFHPTTINKMLIYDNKQIIGWICANSRGCDEEETGDDDDYIYF